MEVGGTGALEAMGDAPTGAAGAVGAIETLGEVAAVVVAAAL
jgi:hypothetical protein